MYIIAEIGINANGDLKLAKDMISEARNCGADACKFQKRSVDIVYTQEFLDSPRETPPGVLAKLPYGGTTQREQKHALEFSWDEYDQIDAHCRTVGIDWFGSAWDVDSLDFLEMYHPPFHKIASPMVTNLPFVRQVARLGRPVIMSTGMSYPQDIKRALDVLSYPSSKGISLAPNSPKIIPGELVLMHCVSEYPVAPDQTFLMEIQALADYGYTVGYSGHESGTTPTIAAVGVGATYIERHFTLDRASYGSDQAASLEPDGFRRIAGCARIAEECLRYRPEEHLTAREIENAMKLRYWEDHG